MTGKAIVKDQTY